MKESDTASERKGYGSSKLAQAVSGLRGTWIFAALLLAMAALAAALPSALLASIAAIYYLAGSVLALRPSARHDLPRRTMASLIYVTVALVTLSGARYFDQIGRQRGTQLVNAITAYHTQYGKYPAQLSDLVPDVIAAVPMADPRPFAANRFRYRRHQDGYFVCYPSETLIGRCYSAQTRQWRVRD